jgi:hypothetical protein
MIKKMGLTWDNKRGCIPALLINVNGGGGGYTSILLKEMPFLGSFMNISLCF